MYPQSEPICALVVDDEAPARQRIVDLLKNDPDISRVLEAENGVAAVSHIRNATPDIVFLDVQMPGVDGFGVIEAVGADKMPLTVFVTAYDHFALQAFEADAVDYLLKPFGNRRYENTMGRAKARLCDLRSRQASKSDLLGPELLKLVEKRSKPGEIWQWILVKNLDSTRLLMTESIDWIKAAGVYLTVHAGGEEFLYRGGLATVASRLDPFHFVRIHRSTVVNVRSIAYLERRSHGDFAVVLKDGSELLMSRTYRAEVEAMLGQSL